MKTIEELKNQIICGDCLEVMKDIPDKSIDLVLTDPPYGVDYVGGQNERERERLKNDKKANVYKDLFPEIKRILKDNGSAYVFYANGKENDIFPYLDFYKYQVIIWNKLNKGFGDIASRYHHTYEPFIYISKGSPTNWYGETNDIDVWITKGGYKNDFHPTQKPLDIISKMIKNSTKENDMVLDCFLGSGTTAVACKQLNRNYIGIEISEKYCEIARQRLRQGILI
jgi:site-specific DNA-methyltransferase (adenine-specific)